MIHRFPGFRRLFAIFAVSLLVLPAGAALGREPMSPAETLLREALSLLSAGQEGPAESRLGEALELFTATEDLRGRSECLLLLGHLKSRRESYAEAMSLYRASSDLRRRLDDPLGAWLALYGLAESSRFLGEATRALAALEEAEEHLRELAASSAPLELGSLRIVAWSQGLPVENLTSLAALLPDLRSLLIGNLTAMTLLSKAAVLREQGLFADATAALQEALPLARQLGILDAQVANALGEVHFAQGRHDEAMAHFEKARDRARELFEGVRSQLALMNVPVPAALRQDEALALRNIASVHLSAGRYDQALAAQREVLAIAQAMDDRLLQGSVIAQMGKAHQAQGRYERARSGYQEGLALAREAGAVDGVAGILDDLSTLDNLEGRHQEALRGQKQSLAMQRRMGHRPRECKVLLNMGLTYVLLQLPEAALEHLKAALEIAQQIGDPAFERNARLRIALIYSQTRHHPEALVHARESLDLARGLGDAVGEVDSLGAVGWIHHAMGRYEAALRHFEQSLTRAREIGYPAGEGVAQQALGTANFELGHDQPALAAYRQALGIFRRTGSEYHEAFTLAGLGALHRRRGEPAAAIEVLRQAAELVDLHQGKIHLSELSTPWNGFLPSTVHAALVDLYASQNDSEAAFLHAERSRSRALLDRLGNPWIDPEQVAGDELGREVAALGRRLTALAGELAAERSREPGVWSTPRSDRLRRELADARRRYADALLELKLRRPEYASLVSVDALSLPEVQAILDAESTLVSFYVLESRVLVWVIDSQAVRLVELGIDRRTLDEKLGELENLLAGRDFDLRVADFLYRRIFAPLRPHLRRPHLILVPHAALHQLPFAALWNVGEQRFLIEDYTLTYVPSASVLRFLTEKRSPNPGRLLVAGNPDGSLPHAAAEAQAIARLYGTRALVGAEATESRVRERAGEVDVLHLATHARVNLTDPRFTRIELAADDAHDGHLEVREILDGLDLRGVNLVVVPACNTAQGERTRGDEILGLTRAFLFAGSPAVVTTRWQIDDRASRFLMETFHRRLRAGAGIADVLREAQLATLEQPQWASPFYWAAFTLNGDRKSIH